MPGSSPDHERGWKSMSHGGVGFSSHHYAHHGLHHHGHDGGHHGGGAQVLNATMVFGMLQGLFVAIFGEKKSVPTLQRWAQALAARQQATGLQGQTLSPEAAEWEACYHLPTWKEKLMQADLRPYIMLALFLGVLFLWLQIIVWLRHHDDPAGKTFSAAQSTAQTTAQTAGQPPAAISPAAFGSAAPLSQYAAPAAPPVQAVMTAMPAGQLPQYAAAAAPAAPVPVTVATAAQPPGVASAYVSPPPPPGQFGGGYYSQRPAIAKQARLRVVVTH